MKSASKALLSLTNVGSFGSDKWLVRGVNLEISQGEIVTLIGPNGSGKSTTVKLALGILKPNEGAAVRAKDLSVGYVPQKLTIDWTLPLTVQRFMQLTSKLSEQNVNEALALTGVEKLKSNQMRTLSGGEFQRVLLARAIAKKPQLLVLDEPVQGVDFAGEIALYELIQDIRNQLECGVLMVSHDLHMVMAATDKVLCLNGHVCCSGSPKVVSENPAYQDLFGNRANPAIALYEHSHDHTHLPDGRVKHADGSITDHCHPDDGHHHDHKGHSHDG